MITIIKDEIKINKSKTYQIQCNCGTVYQYNRIDIKKVADDRDRSRTVDYTDCPRCGRMNYHSEDNEVSKKYDMDSLAQEYVNGVRECNPQEFPTVIVMNEYGKATSAWYDYERKEWHLSYGEIADDDLIDSKITHWMNIPSLEGGEK